MGPCRNGHIMHCVHCNGQCVSIEETPFFSGDLICHVSYKAVVQDIHTIWPV